MSDEEMIAFGRFCFRDPPAEPDIPGAVEYAKSHPVVLASDWFGGALNMVIRSRAPSAQKLDGVKALIGLGAKPEGLTDEDSTLCSAVGQNDLEIARFLLPLIDIAACNASRYSALALAIHEGNLEMVKLLVEAGMNPGKNHNGTTMITRARQYGHKEIEEYLRSKCTPEQLAQVPDAGSYAEVLAMNFAPVRKSASHVLMGVSVHFAGNLLITEGLGGESRDGSRIEFFIEMAEGAQEDWALAIVMAAVDGLRSGKGIASDIGEIVPIKGVPKCKYSHLLLLKDRQAGSVQFFRAFPILKKEAKFAIKAGARALVVKFKEHDIPGNASPERKSVV